MNVGFLQIHGIYLWAYKPDEFKFKNLISSVLVANKRAWRQGDAILPISQHAL